MKERNMLPSGYLELTKLHNRPHGIAKDGNEEFDNVIWLCYRTNILRS